MRFDEMSLELMEDLKKKAEKCETDEERLALLAENGIELTEEQLEGIAGGRGPKKVKRETCPATGKYHKWVKTGNKRPGERLGPFWPDYEYRCVNCNRRGWA